MKLLADENIPLSVVKALEEAGYDIVGIRGYSPGISDIAVMQYAHSEHRVILTFDKDFGELAVKERATPCPGVILIRIPKKNPAWIAEYVRAVIQSRKDWEGQFSVIEEDRVRMRSLRP